MDDYVICKDLAWKEDVAKLPIGACYARLRIKHAGCAPCTGAGTIMRWVPVKNTGSVCGKALPPDQQVPKTAGTNSKEINALTVAGRQLQKTASGLTGSRREEVNIKL